MLIIQILFGFTFSMGQSVTSFTLINADTEQAIKTLIHGEVLNLSTLPTKNVNIRANTSPTTVGSVMFSLTGSQNRNHTENGAPYALFGDNNGNYHSWTPSSGSYTLTATPYTATAGGGTRGAALTISFTVSNSTTPNQAPLANAGTDKSITLPTSSVVLNGSGTDPDGSIIALGWIQVSGPNQASFSNTAIASPTVSGLVQGSYLFRLTVKDDKGSTDTDEVAVVVNPTPTTVVSGELKKWHKVTITFTGPSTSESSTPNPFLDYRLTVTFSQGTRQVLVPGYYAADGNAAETSSSSGNKWRVHFSPDEEGLWSYKASFRTGSQIAVNSMSDAGSSVSFDGYTGSFTIRASDKSGADFRAKGRLHYVGEHYLKFAQTGQYFLKGGADSPENFLAYADFDGTSNYNSTSYIKTYLPHVADWRTGDPTWKGGKGKGMIGALNYLASKGMNSVYFLTNNVNGDGKDVWPWTSYGERYRFDVSKLDQWERVFSHMDKLGIMLHVVTQEQENDQLLDGGALGIQRKLYYRELIARFGHHLAINWNLGEENTNTDAQRKAFASYIKGLDPYDSYINVHTFPDQQSTVLTPLLGYSSLDGVSLQIANVNGILPVHTETLKWVNQSASSRRKWVVNLDEIGSSSIGVLPDANDYLHDLPRKQALWGNLMAGGGGVEWYFGYSYANNDLSCQDWRSRDNMWNLTGYALQFFRSYLPFWQMKNHNSLTGSTSDFCFASPGKVYAIYLPNGGTTTLNVGTTWANYQIKWYNPRTGGSLQNGSIEQVSGSGDLFIGYPPMDSTKDWVCLVTNMDSTARLTSAEAQQLEYSAHISLYPNPAQDQMSLEIQLPSEAPLEISIVDINGKRLWVETSVAVKTYSKQISVSNFKPGIYLLTVKYGTEFITKRILK